MTVKQAEETLTARQSTQQRMRATTGMGVDAPVAMTADECRKACEKLKKEYLPGYEARVLSYVITNESRDSYGDIVRVKGCDLKRYLSNPVVMYCHEHGDLPVGASLSVKTDKALKRITSQALFLDSRVDTSGRSDLVFKFAQSGMMPGCSIGFMPRVAVRPQTPEERESMGLGEWGVEYQVWELLEWSPCALPSNPDALQLSIKSLGDRTKDITREDLIAAEKAAIFDGEWLDVVERTLLGVSLKSIPVVDPAPATKVMAGAPKCQCTMCENCAACESYNEVLAEDDEEESTPGMSLSVALDASKLSAEVDKYKTLLEENLAAYTKTIMELTSGEGLAALREVLLNVNDSLKRIETASASLQQAANRPVTDGPEDVKSLYDLLLKEPDLG